MSNGFVPGWAFVISDNEVQKICEEAYRNFKIALSASQIPIEDFGSEVMFIDECTKEDEIDTLSYRKNDLKYMEAAKAYLQLLKDFKGHTNISLSLCVHDKDGMGDRYDEVDGAFWVLSEGVQEKTVCAIELEKILNRPLYTSTWVTYV